jgi:hypothetical protein
MPSTIKACGPIAQSVEQLAFNQWVAGSSPARLIFNINKLRAVEGLSVTLQVDNW